jgi:phage shock protein PspC (stress-responsive transcriptional regulator)
MSEHTLQTPMVKRLERSRSEKMLAGVCGGLGRYFDIAPAVFRLGFVVLTLLGGAGILVYIAAVLVMPKEGEESSVAEDVLKKRREHPARLVALGLIAVAVLSLLARADTWPSAGASWFLVLTAGVVLLWTSSRRRGVVVAITTFLAVLVAVAVAAVSVAFAWFDVSLGDGVGDNTYQPTSISDVKPKYETGVGNLRVDLSQIGPVTKETHVKASVGVGELRIIVPRDAAVSVNAHAKLGDVYVLQRHDDGKNAALRVGQGPLVIDAKVGAGRIDVVRAG